VGDGVPVGKAPPGLSGGQVQRGDHARFGEVCGRYRLVRRHQCDAAGDGIRPGTLVFPPPLPGGDVQGQHPHLPEVVRTAEVGRDADQCRGVVGRPQLLLPAHLVPRTALGRCGRRLPYDAAGLARQQRHARLDRIAPEHVVADQDTDAVTVSDQEGQLLAGTRVQRDGLARQVRLVVLCPQHRARLDVEELDAVLRADQQPAVAHADGSPVAQQRHAVSRPDALGKRQRSEFGSGPGLGRCRLLGGANHQQHRQDQGQHGHRPHRDQQRSTGRLRRLLVHRSPRSSCERPLDVSGS